MNGVSSLLFSQPARAAFALVNLAKLLLAKNRDCRYITRAAFMSIGLSLLSASAAVSAQGMRIDITGVGDRQIPIAIAPLLTADPQNRALADTVLEVVQADLRRTGSFSLLPVGPQNPPLSENTAVNPT